MLREFSSKSKNEIIFLQKVGKGSLGDRLLKGEKEIRVLETSVIGILDDDNYQDQNPASLGIRGRSDSVMSN
jgi:hypothetical protein